jgi:anti-sigma regulatory factor (Ser/Thr protein kinase)
MSNTRSASTSEQRSDDTGVRTRQSPRSDQRRLLTPPPSGGADTVHGTADSSSEPGSGAGPAFPTRRQRVMPHGTWPLRSHLALGALPGAVPCARLHSKQVLWEWGLAQLSEPTELIVSEIITNAIQAVTARVIPAPVLLWLLSDHTRVHIAVWDADARPPQFQPTPVDGGADWSDERGRGLLIVASISKRWGWYPTPGWGGKVVWAEITG